MTLLNLSPSKYYQKVLALIFCVGALTTYIAFENGHHFMSFLAALFSMTAYLFLRNQNHPIQSIFLNNGFLEFHFSNNKSIARFVDILLVTSCFFIIRLHKDNKSFERLLIFTDQLEKAQQHEFLFLCRTSFLRR